MTVQRLQKERSDPVAGGFYSVGEAARLLGIQNAGKVTSWLQGRRGAKAGPVIIRQYSPYDNVQEVGFWDLIEVRFVEHFRRQGISLQSLRKAAQTAREEWKVQHPFALSKAKYMTDRKHIFQVTAEAEKDDILLNLVTKQFAMYVVIEEVLDRGLTFDPATGLAREWKPSIKEFPHVLLSPTVAYGQPSVSGIPTNAIYSSWRAEEGQFEAVADWFGIEPKLAREAVEFELSLPT